MIAVLAVPAEEPNVTALEHDVPTADEPVVANEKPLSVARSVLTTFTAEPNSAWNFVVVTELLAANTRMTSERAALIAVYRTAVFEGNATALLALPMPSLFSRSVRVCERNLSYQDLRARVTVCMGTIAG